MSITHVKAGDPLHPREVEVLMLLSNDWRGTEIAEKLGFSQNTVRDYMRRIHRKLDVQSSAGAVARALREGIIR